jgi:hypothetical protein
MNSTIAVPTLGTPDDPCIDEADTAWVLLSAVLGKSASSITTVSLLVFENTYSTLLEVLDR